VTDRYHEDQLDFADCHLMNWARYMRSGHPVDTLPSRSLVMSTGGYSKDIGEFSAELDIWSAKATEALIRDLSMIQQHIIANAYLASVWRFRPAVDRDKELSEAKSYIERGLAGRGIVWIP
jgi:hypothetical protein